ncbi:hypothetical protein M378DRAFT_15253 [Amanita muscaria Koide BX008]|uniref:Uncharacterized protein n=1 Tax=Amanita muscaria (strain Koide BX008) TaxID=946122 RepID=A0A0C2WPY3_AMAMK|nr:hypothetical protein M378DRAFT_15253 [Amanita muscaria Koide BX008]
MPPRRDPSPFASAAVGVTAWGTNVAATSLNNRRGVRDRALARTTSVEEVLSIIPPGWVDHFDVDIRWMSRVAEKRLTIAGLLAEYRALRTLNRFPSFVPSKRPTLQLGKDFHSSAAGKTSVKELDEAWEESRLRIYDAQFKAKENELNSLEAELSSENVWARVVKTFSKASQQLRHSRMEPVFPTGYTVPIEGQEVPAEATAPVTFVVAASWDDECTEIRRDSLMWMNHVRLLTESKFTARNAQKDKKRKLKDAADAAPVDAMVVDPTPGSSNDSTRKIIQAEVNRAVKRLKTNKSEPASSTPKGKDKKKDKGKKSAEKKKEKKSNPAPKAGSSTQTKPIESARQKAERQKAEQKERWGEHLRVKAGLRKATALMAQFPGSSGN